MIQQSAAENIHEPNGRITGSDEKSCEFCGEIIKIRDEICPKCGVHFRKRVGNTGLPLWPFFLVFVIGILAAITIPEYARFRTRANNAKAFSDLRNTATAQEQYFLEHEEYAASIEALIGPVYGLYIDEDVKISMQSVDGKNYLIVAFHERGTKKYMLRGPNGKVQESPKR
jgi:Tfp pilus assembly protein PilE